LNSTSPYSSLWLDMKGVAFQQSYLDVGGCRTRFLSAGAQSNPLLLFLHGTGGHAEAYSRNLAIHAEHFFVVALDMIGHGWTDKPEIDYEIPAYAAHVLDAIKALGHDKAYVSGESLGGWVATYLAIHRPEVLEKIVLNTTGGWTAHPEVMKRIVALSRQSVENPTHESLRARLEFLMFDKSLVNHDLVETRLAIYKQPGYREITERVLCLQDMETRRRNMFTREQYGSITTPTLVLWTSHDPTASVEEGREIASMIPNSRFEVIQDCGHWPQFETPVTFNRIHLDFLLGRETQ
jgi:2-hydroxy-6-oxonona-2,4-dienedioate hydrolase